MKAAQKEGFKIWCFPEEKTIRASDLFPKSDTLRISTGLDKQLQKRNLGLLLCTLKQKWLSG